MSSDDGSRPWADLPVEMIDSVTKHLDLFSAARLAAVSKSWQRAVETDPTLPFGSLCLLLTREFDENGYYADYEEDSFTLLDLTHKDEGSRRALLWGVQEQRWIGGKDDWLATVDDSGNARLVNPYSGQQIDLPDSKTVVPGAAKTWSTFPRIIVCETPNDAAGSGYLVIALVSTGLAIARGGDESWKALRNSDEYTGFRWSDAVVHKGKVFAVNYFGSIYTWDIRAGASLDAEREELSKPSNVNDEFECRWRLAESADGSRLLLVCIYGEQIDCEKTTGYRRRVFTYTAFHPEGVRLYERDVDAATGSDDGWSAVSSLGDNSLFLGVNYPIWASINQRGPSDFWSWPPQLLPNCVYVTNNQSLSSQSAECDMDMFDLGAEGEPPRHRSSRLYSDLFNLFQTPMWFKPELRNSELQ